ncbi:MAG: hypothetical protein SAK29_27890 [Scytonema sp. PMC 1069.18]|nr:hypothetical protein [Scytonema sp. PMC 1069.18]MEC4884066.1 hypothetical protein [Scytonema sp. PMC 1070.18]
MQHLILILATTAFSLLGLQFFVKAQNFSIPQTQIQNFPLAKYPGFGHNLETEEERFNQEAKARELLIARCMQLKNLPYNTSTVVTENNDEPEQDITTVKDPNVSYAESLSSQKRREYYLALYGVPDPNASSADELYNPNAPGGSGCQGEAFSAITGVFAASSALKEEYIALQKSILEDSRVQAAEQRWSVCMKKQGYEYESTSDLRAEFDKGEAQSRSIPELRHQHQQATIAGNMCAKEVGLSNIIAQVRSEKEAKFVAENKEFLDQHLERLNNEEELINKILY